jgi:hypothetical protein
VTHSSDYSLVSPSKPEVLEQRKIDHSGNGIIEFMTWMETLTEGHIEGIAASIEVPRGPLVEAFLEHRWAVFSINPKQLDRFRDRHTVAGAKDDSRDAYVLADSLRTDQHCFRRVEADHPTVVRIRELSRTEESVGADLRRTVNQLYQLLLRYYPLLGEPGRLHSKSFIRGNWRIGAAAYMGDRQTANGFERIVRRVHARPSSRRLISPLRCNTLHSLCQEVCTVQELCDSPHP